MGFTEICGKILEKNVKNIFACVCQNLYICVNVCVSPHPSALRGPWRHHRWCVASAHTAQGWGPWVRMDRRHRSCWGQTHADHVRLLCLICYGDLRRERGCECLDGSKCCCDRPLESVLKRLIFSSFTIIINTTEVYVHVPVMLTSLASVTLFSPTADSTAE